MMPTDAPAAGSPLRQLQESFLAGLREADAAKRLAASGVFLEPPRGAVGQRLQIYREGYLRRLAEAIKNDYPALARILGPDAFRSLARRYLAACPPAACGSWRQGAGRLLCSGRLARRHPESLGDAGSLSSRELRAVGAGWSARHPGLASCGRWGAWRES